MNMLTRSNSGRGARAAKLEVFDGSRDKAEQFVQSILYCSHNAAQTCSWMWNNESPIWPLINAWRNSTSLCHIMRPRQTLSHSSTLSTLADYWQVMRGAFGDLDWERMECTQLHALKMKKNWGAWWRQIYAVLDACRKDWLQQGGAGRMHSSRASLSWFSLKCTPRPHYHQAWTTGRQVVHNLEHHPLGFTTEMVNPSFWMQPPRWANPQMQTPQTQPPPRSNPSHWPHSRHLHTHGPLIKLTQTWGVHLL